MSDVEHVLAVQDEVGETPLWISEEKALYWIDIEGTRVHRLDPADGQHQTFPVDFPITALALLRVSRSKEPRGPPLNAGHLLILCARSFSSVDCFFTSARPRRERSVGVMPSRERILTISFST